MSLRIYGRSITSTLSPIGNLRIRAIELRIRAIEVCAADAYPGLAHVVIFVARCFALQRFLRLPVSFCDQAIANSKRHGRPRCAGAGGPDPVPLIARLPACRDHPRLPGAGGHAAR